MEIKKEFPPNFKEIKQNFPTSENTVYCYGNIIYNPSGQEIPIDIQYHESIHSRQQLKYMSPDIWWTKYIYDSNFRLTQELEAFAEQLNFVKRSLGSKASKYCLEELAENLSILYNLNISYYRAHSLIRHFVVK